MSEFFYKTVTYQSFVVPPLCYVWAWWSWIRTEKSAVPSWRRDISKMSLGLLFVGIGFGAFSISYLYTHPEPGAVLPDATIWSMVAGAIFGILALVTSMFSKSWTLALVISSADLLFFLYLIALSP